MFDKRSEAKTDNKSVTHTYTRKHTNNYTNIVIPMEEAVALHTQTKKRSVGG